MGLNQLEDLGPEIRSIVRVRRDRRIGKLRRRGDHARGAAGGRAEALSELRQVLTGCRLRGIGFFACAHDFRCVPVVQDETSSQCHARQRVKELADRELRSAIERVRGIFAGAPIIRAGTNFQILNLCHEFDLGLPAFVFKGQILPVFGAVILSRP